MPFTGVNYKLLLIGLAVVVVGFLLMAGGGNGDPNAFDESADLQRAPHHHRTHRQCWQATSSWSTPS
jgi:hypothetical protein